MCIRKGLHAMDKFDWKIIQALQHNGRLTNQEIGDLIGLSASQCSRRRQLLEQKGIILGYNARIDPQALGIGVIAMVQINLKTHDAYSKHAFQQLIEEEECIQEAFSLSGDTDFILKVVAPDLELLSRFVTEKLIDCEFIGHIKSYIVLKKLKEQYQHPFTTQHSHC